MISTKISPWGTGKSWTTDQQVGGNDGSNPVWAVIGFPLKVKFDDDLSVLARNPKAVAKLSNIYGSTYC